MLSTAVVARAQTVVVPQGHIQVRRLEDVEATEGSLVGMSRSARQRDMDVTLPEGVNFRSHMPTSLCPQQVSPMNSACEETPIPQVSTCGPTCTWVIHVSVTSERDIRA